MEAQTEPTGYKTIIMGGDEHNNCTKLDIIKLNDKSIFFDKCVNYTALSDCPKKHMQCCTDASKTCSILTNA